MNATSIYELALAEFDADAARRRAPGLDKMLAGLEEHRRRLEERKQRREAAEMKPAVERPTTPSVPMESAFAEIRTAGIRRVAVALGLTVRPTGLSHGFGPCPSCKSELRHRKSNDRRPACGMRPDDRGWLCFQCNTSGDAATLASLVLLGARKPRTAAEFARLAAWASSLQATSGTIACADAAADRPSEPPAAIRHRPPLAELRAFCRACGRLDRPDLVAAWTSGRGDPNPYGLRAAQYLLSRLPGATLTEIAALDIVRLAPAHATTDFWPQWWPWGARPWTLVTRAFEPDGRLASIHARAVSPAKAKTRWPRGCSAHGLLFADRAGLALLRGKPPGDLAGVLICEGVTDFWAAALAAAQLAQVGPRWAVLAGTSGSFDALVQVRWPAQVAVILAQDADEAGERYVEQSRRGLAGCDVVVKRAKLPPGKDIADILAKGSDPRAVVLERLIAGAEPVPACTALVRVGAAALARQAPSGSTVVPAATEQPGLLTTDLANAERLVQAHFANLRYVPGWGWRIFDGQRWQHDDSDQIMRWAKETALRHYETTRVRALTEFANLGQQATTDPRLALQFGEALQKHARRSLDAPRLRAAIDLAASEAAVIATPADFDRDPWLLNVLNGTLDLRTGQLREHRHADLLTKVAPVVFDPAAACPTWCSFLGRVTAGNTLLVEFLQRWIGYCLTGDTPEHCLLVLFGVGANGKSTFLETVRALLGDYAAVAEFATFLEKKNDRVLNDLARLAGARFVSASEIQACRRLDEALVKQVTGGDTIAARFLFKEYFEFRPVFKLLLAANHKPQVQGQDEGIWRRLRMVPFSVTIPAAERDKDLPAKLRGELSGVLNWALEGCRAWQRQGLGEPPAVLEATAEYREEMDPLGPFLAACCVLGPSLRASASDLYIAYQQWCATAAEQPLTQKAFGSKLAEHGLSRKKSGGNIHWHGIALRTGDHPAKGTEGRSGTFILSPPKEK